MMNEELCSIDTDYGYVLDSLSSIDHILTVLAVDTQGQCKEVTEARKRFIVAYNLILAALDPLAEMISNAKTEYDLQAAPHE